MPRIVFTPSGLDGEFDADATVLDAARELGVDLDSVCGGRGICGRCQVVVSEGRFPKWNIEVGADALRVEERTKKTARALVDGQILGCAAHLTHDVVIDIPPSSQVHRQVVRKHVDLEGVVIDPHFELHYVELTKPELGQERSASGQLVDALLAQHRVHAAGIATAALRRVHKATASGSATVAVDIGTRSIVAVWPGFVDTAYGIAIDVGSTTIAGHLCDLSTGEIVATAGRMNPQIRYGEDLMSRVSYVMMNPGGDVELTTAIRAALQELTTELLATELPPAESVEKTTQSDHPNPESAFWVVRLGGSDAEDSAEQVSAQTISAQTISADRVLDMTIVGNPIMHHVLLGIDPTPLGLAPFILATDEAVHTTARELDLDLPFAHVYLAPCIAGHVGADTAAAMLAEGPHRSAEMQLLVDVGTNAEIVLGNAARQLAASSPTGPAFEGAQISCGQRATAGAIERVRIDRDTLVPRVKVIGCDLWSDDPAFDAATEHLTISGVCGSGIIEVIGEMYLSGVIDSEGVVDGSNAARTARVVAEGRTYAYLLFERDDITLQITQNDVRAIQLAKAALRAGIDLLIEHAGSPKVNDVRLAGAFGAHIDPVYALVLGLVPDCPVGSVRSVGNAAGAGAVRALLSMGLRAEMEVAVRKVEKIETATEPRFQELFVAAMAFPHATAPSPHLATVMTLPERTTSVDGTRVRRRGRQRAEAAEAQATAVATQQHDTTRPGGPDE